MLVSRVGRLAPLVMSLSLLAAPCGFAAATPAAPFPPPSATAGGDLPIPPPGFPSNLPPASPPAGFSATLQAGSTETPAEASGNVPAISSDAPGPTLALPASGDVGYGIADTGNNFNNYYQNCWFLSITTTGYSGTGCFGAHTGSIGYVRLFVPWDALEYSTTSTGSATCAYSPAEQAGATAWYTLVQGLKDIGVDHLIPLVSITAGTGDSLPVVPTDNDYACGLYALMYATTHYSPTSLHVPAWEVFNEPDGQQFTATNKYGHTGAAAAADLYVDAWWGRDAAGSGDANDELIAGAFTYATLYDNCCTYMNAYFPEIGDAVGEGYPAPTAFSGHPYTDVVTGGATHNNGYNASTANLRNTEVANGFSEPLWLTEAADWLQDPDNGSTNGNAEDQAYAAWTWTDLPAFEDVQRVYWYDYEAGGAGFDSGLLGPDGAGRPSYCFLYGDPYTDCNSRYYNQLGDYSVPTGYYGINTTSGGYQCRFDGATPDNGANPLGVIDMYVTGGAAPTNTASFDISSTTESVATACYYMWGS